MGGAPLISVVIPTYQRPERIRRTLLHFEKVRFRPADYELIVVDDGSEPPLEAATLAAPDGVSLTVLRVPHGGSGAARNAGVARARGELIAFLADDCEPDSDWLQALAAAHAQHPDCALGGGIVHGLPDDACSTTADLLIQYMRSRANADPLQATFFTPNNLAVPAAGFRAVGGFDAQFNPAGEDRDFCARWVESGRRMISLDGARVLHTHSLTFFGFLRMQYTHGRGSMLFRRVMARRNGGGVHLEAPGYYAGLFMFPFARPGEFGLRHVALLAVSQVAVAAGAASVYWGRRRRVVGAGGELVA